MGANAQVYLRHVRESDRREFVALMRESEVLHTPWITPPTSAQGFSQYLSRTRTDDHEGFVLARYLDDRIVGVINLNNVVRGSFLSASLGYYVGAPFQGAGYMADGLELVKRHAFQVIGLHRLEANIQPDNKRSIALVKRCGFQLEGLAPAFLYINGEWRDHERWSCVDHRTSMQALRARTPNNLAEHQSTRGSQPPEERKRVAMRALTPDDLPPESTDT